jgi:hypothetical protein
MRRVAVVGPVHRVVVAAGLRRVAVVVVAVAGLRRAAAVVVAVVAVAGVRLLAEVENGADVLWQFAESEWVC